ncbi:hypothetical protein KVT40_008462 [Elsinoe batatas]|uniref:tRNA (adenine(58)-N(1))-methyltransferase catalytic subunit TRM61 n=1 Tax=Elsinoe batatas TaxID=2601811 RepID=A0A8K0KT81_9PEZI|nr:hypothetical protein KVT40_008462 [Elsinoe batatas]
MPVSWWQKLTQLFGTGVQKTSILKQDAVTTTSRLFSARDIVLLRPLGRSGDDGKLTKPLSPTGKIEGHKGTIHHSDIIGRNARDIIKSTTGAPFRAHHVTLSDYVRLSRRLVTPIYPADANLIVSLFDIHVQPSKPGSQPSPRYEILEAGTGHGALTLHLSRAINGGNPTRTSDQGEDEWRASRQAILHTVDISEKYSKHAEKIVTGFRQGMYAGNVNFNVGSVSDWVQAEIESRGHSEPFLSNAFLDLPGLEDHLASVSSALLPDAKLVVFAPSITQILACFEKARKDRLPLILGQVVELGTNGSSGGREWDVRAVVPRDKLKKRSVSRTKAETAEEVSSEGSSSEADVVDNDISAEPVEPAEPAEQQSDVDEKLVCRPKVGDRITGGGFLAVFIKKGQDG